MLKYLRVHLFVAHYVKFNAKFFSVDEKSKKFDPQSEVLAIADEFQESLVEQQATGLKIPRFYTEAGKNPLDQVEWDTRSSIIKNPDGSVVFEMDNVEVPKFWSQVATDVLAQKYFRKAGVPQKDKNGNIILDSSGKPVLGSENSAKQILHRLASGWTHWGKVGGYFATEEDAQIFYDELAHMLVNQIASPNSPQWFNTGLNLVYDINGPAQGHYYFDPQTGQLIQSKDSYSRPQVHACFIQSIKDDLVNPGGIMDLWMREARIYKYGSGSGTNFSNIRGEGEPLSGGGKSSGVLSFLKIGDVTAGSIKSGGTTRRASKMVILDDDHPEIEKFINWKYNEEKKVAALIAAGYPSDYEGEAYSTVSGQNSNNSVRVSNKFMESVANDDTWDLKWRTNGKVCKTLKARDMWNQVGQAAWACADPGLQFDTIINDWHTCPNSGKIRASNPCSEYMFLDDTACNLASLNIMKFFDPDTKTFDVDAFKHAVRIWTIVLEISVFMAQYPSAEIAKRSYEFRTLGLGYTNLGTMLMVSGIPYDSEDSRAIAAAISGIMGGESYATSAEIASVLGPFPKYEENKDDMLRVIRNHRRAAYNADEKEYEKVEIKPVGINHKMCPGYLLNAAINAWDRALELGEKYGYRNAQSVLIAPTGTISLQMDCDTTGIEPDFAIVKFKKLAGGGYFKIVNQSVSLSLKNLGYSQDEIGDIIKYIAGTNSLRGSPYINEFTLKMKGFSQEDLQKVEKNLPSVFDLKQAFTFWNLGKDTIEKLNFKAEQYDNPKFDLLKALGFSDQEIEVANDFICGTMTIEGAPHLKEEHYRVFDCANKCGRKGKRMIGYMGHILMMSAVQPFLSGSISKTINMPNDSTIDDVKNAYMQSWKLGLKSIALYRDGSKLSQPLNTKTDEKKEVKLPARRKLPAERKSITHKFRVGNQEGYLTVGLYEDGTPGEIFVKMAKEGSSLAGMMDSFGLAIAMALQYGTPLKVLVDKFVHTRFEPSGWTDNPQIQVAKSIVDYIFRWLGLKFLPESEHRSLGINGAKTYELSETEKQAKLNVFADESKKSEDEDENFDDAQVCSDCGSFMVRSGSCYVCTSCGTTSGCS